jgi:peptidoglycan hydrolase CwlO-like protein
MIQIFTTLEQLMPVVEGVKKENEELKASLKSNEQSVMELKAQVSQLEKVLSNPMGVNG